MIAGRTPIRRGAVLNASSADIVAALCCGTAAVIRRFGELRPARIRLELPAATPSRVACQSSSSASSSSAAWARSRSAGSRADHQGVSGSSGRMVSSQVSVETALSSTTARDHGDGRRVPEAGGGGPGRSGSGRVEPTNDREEVDVELGRTVVAERPAARTSPACRGAAAAARRRRARRRSAARAPRMILAPVHLHCLPPDQFRRSVRGRCIGAATAATETVSGAFGGPGPVRALGVRSWAPAAAPRRRSDPPDRPARGVRAAAKGSAKPDDGRDDPRGVRERVGAGVQTAGEARAGG